MQREGAVRISNSNQSIRRPSDFTASVRGGKQGETQPDCRSTEPTRPSVIIQLSRLIPAPVSVYTSAPRYRDARKTRPGFAAVTLAGWDFGRMGLAPPSSYQLGMTYSRAEVHHLIGHQWPSIGLCLNHPTLPKNH